MSKNTGTQESTLADTPRPACCGGTITHTIMGGLLVATLLTILFVPALYAAWLRLPVPENAGKSAT